MEMSGSSSGPLTGMILPAIRIRVNNESNELLCQVQVDASHTVGQLVSLVQARMGIPHGVELRLRSMATQHLLGEDHRFLGESGLTDGSGVIAEWDHRAGALHCALDHTEAMTEPRLVAVLPIVTADSVCEAPAMTAQRPVRGECWLESGGLMFTLAHAAQVGAVPKRARDDDVPVEAIMAQEVRSSCVTMLTSCMHSMTNLRVAARQTLPSMMEVWVCPRPGEDFQRLRVATDWTVDDLKSTIQRTVPGASDLHSSFKLHVVEVNRRTSRIISTSDEALSPFLTLSEASIKHGTCLMVVRKSEAPSSGQPPGS